MDNAILIERGLLARKGAPETFDVRAFLDIVTAVRPADQEVLVPVFDRSREIAIASARAVSPDHRFIIVEGNYLLFNQGNWAELDGMFDFSIMLGPPIEVLEERLWARWTRLRAETKQASHAKVYDNDLPNGRLILGNRRPADVTIEIVRTRTWQRLDPTIVFTPMHGCYPGAEPHQASACRRHRHANSSPSAALTTGICICAMAPCWRA